jgi:glycosyltransferase involved in cell wall biosynthesis
MLGLGWFPDTLGGLERYYRALLESLPEARGVVIGPAGDGPARVTAVADAGSGLARRLAGYTQAARRAARDTDIVDAYFALYALGPIYSRALRGSPLVIHFQGPWAQENVAAGDLSPARRLLRRMLERSVLRRADAAIVLSGAFRRVLVEDYGISPWHIRVWRPGVDTSAFTPGDRERARAGLGVEPSAFVVVCARRLVARMGIEVLLDAWAQLEGALPEGSTLLVIGDGPLRDELEQRAGRAPLAGRVRVLGRISDEQLVEAYRAADVAAVPTLAVEGFGLVVLEAAACGTPSIVTDVGGLPEATAGLDRSLIVAPGDVDALATRLLSASRGALPGRDDTRAFAEGHDWTALAERHRRLYERLVKGTADTRPRVVFLDHVARLSGGEIALLRVLPHLRRVNAHVILGEDGPLAERLSQAGVSVEVMPIAPSARDVRKDSLRGTGASPVAMLHTLAYTVRLAARLRRLRPDLVHVNSLKSGIYGGLAARLAGVPVLWHLRDRVAEDYLPGPAVRLVRMLVRRLADGVIANSAATLETVKPSARNRIHRVIADSVELPPLVQEAAKAPGIVFGMLGRISPWKGQDLFLRAFAASFSGGQERALIVGTPMFGEESYELELGRLVTDLGLEGRVEFRGFREDIWQELASFDVLVHASVIPEPFGQVVLEGMAAGLAVIAPDEGGPASIITDGRTGLLFASRDAGSLGGAMLELRDDPERREQLGTAARVALGSYHPAVIAEQLESVYAELSRSRRRRATA